MKWASRGGRLSAAEAHDWGPVNRLSEDGEVLTDAVAMARRFAELSVSVATIKQAHHRALETEFVSQLDYEAGTQGWLQQQPDFAEATQAFAEKRPPRLAERTPPDRTKRRDRPPIADAIPSFVRYAGRRIPGLTGPPALPLRNGQS